MANPCCLIMSVFNFPELYNVTLPTYRCTETRINAWRSISTLMGVPCECLKCKRRWKNMRDRYLKEVRTELKSKQQGELVPSRWKYRQRLNFLAPFTGTRNGISENFINNNGEDHSPPDLDTLAADSPMSPSQNNQWGTLGDEDELFLLSFVPTLKRLAPQKRCETKMKIQQILYEAEFSLPELDSGM
uniref:Uncharacterized LOC115542182 n=1 Tax=Gadus morhua TaxID=8049 RepID=A0A8C5CPX4_GADMO